MSGEVWEWELRLLRATIGGEPLATARIDSPADGHNALLQLAIEGKYREIFDLATEAGILISGGAVRVGDPAAFEALEGHLISTWSTALQFEDLGCAVKLFAVGVAALLLFVQANVTGPEHDTSQPQCSLVQNGAQCEHHLPGKASSVSGPAACASNERWAERQLAVDSEDLFAKCQLPQYLLLARRVLVDLLQLNRRASAQAALKQVQSPGLAEDEEVEGSKESRTIQCGESEYQLATLEEMIDPSRAKSFVESALPSWFWWAARAVAIHQRLLSRKSATLRTELVALTDDTMKIFNVTNRERVPPVVRAAALLEAGLWELQYRHIEAAKAFLSHAEAALGLVVDLSGAMGVRTAHQQEAKAQLFVKVQHTHEEGIETDGCDMNSIPIFGNLKEGSVKDPTVGSGDADVLPLPMFDELPEGARALRELRCIEQAALLARCALIELGTARDELRTWEMVPYVEALRVQHRSAFMIQAAAALYRARHERERSRTRQRALLVTEQLVEAVRIGSAVLQLERRYCAMTVWLPVIASLRRELAEQQVANGLVGDAIKTYEELEMWDNLITCYQLLGKDAQAGDLIAARLKEDPNNPRLWCALGDLKHDDECYRMAWDRSGQHYARAQRSLARSALGRKDFVAAAECFETALAISPLFPDAWFSLGYCYLKRNYDRGALKAFTRCAQLDPDHGEAWNNLGALWMRASKPTRAVWAFKEAIKAKKNNWRMWENFAQASIESGEWMQAARGLTQVLDLTGAEHLKLEMVEALVNRESAAESEVPGLKATVGALLERAVKGLPSFPPNLWRIYARHHRAVGDPGQHRECMLKSVRQLQGSQWRHDQSRFEELASAMADLCRDYLESGRATPSPGAACSEQPEPGGQGMTQGSRGQRSDSALPMAPVSVQDLASMRMQLKGVVKQGREAYEDSDSYKTLSKLLEEITGVEERLRTT